MCAKIVEITYDSVDGNLVDDNPDTTLIAGCQIGVLEIGHTGRCRVDVLGTELFNKETCFLVRGKGGLDPESEVWNHAHGNIVFKESTLLFYLSMRGGAEKLYVRYPPKAGRMDKEVLSGQSFYGLTFKII